MNRWVQRATQGGVIALALGAFLAATPVSAAGWVQQTTGVTWNIEGVAFYDSNYGVAVGTNGKTLYTSNGGNTWASGATVSGGRTLYDVSASDGDFIAVGGAGIIAKSEDWGATWVTKTSGVSTYLYGVSMSGDNGFAVGANGVILYTMDAGDSWSLAASGTTQTLWDVQYLDNLDTAVAVGANGTIVYSTDDGVTWTTATSGVTTTLFGVDFRALMMGGNYTAAVVGSDGTYLTSTNLSTWTSDPTGASVTSPLVDIAMAGLGADSAVVVGDTTILKGYEANTEWYIESFATALNAVARDLATGDAWVVGNSGKIYAYNDDEPVLSAITPSTATVGTEVTFTLTAESDSDIESCDITIGEASAEPMTVVGNTATYAHTFSTSGNVAVTASCEDFYRLSATSDEITVTVAAATSADTTAPTVGSVTPTSAVAGTASTLSATYSDAVGVSSCTLYVGGVSQGSMTLSAGTASRSYTFSSATYPSGGTGSAYVTCVDAAGNVGTGATTSIAISAPASSSSDTTAPTIGLITPTTATQNSARTFTVTVTDASGVQECRLYVNGSDQGGMTAGSSNTYSRSYTPASSSSFTVYASCGDTVGNIGEGTAVTVSVTAVTSSGTDVTAPTVGAISPSTATAGTAATLRASVADSVGVSGCTLYVDSANAGSMTISGGYASASYTFDDDGESIANAYCWDAAGNTTRGASTTITIAAAAEEAEDEAEPGNLLKLACAADSEVNDPCRAVYYYSEVDGKRHAFPNEKVFFSWYRNFDDVIIVSNSFMASLTLGRNVTYKPGVTMVKFITVNTVYAVGEEGELRAIDSEDTARSIWGSTWNQQIHDISDAFYSNYEFGEDIDSTSDYDPDDVERIFDTIDDLLDVQ